MKFARPLLIFSYGLFSIAAQSLLFREFITTFEGNDISVGIFFASWFLWVGLGAIVVYRARRLAGWLLENIEFLFLSYVPAFVLELVLIIHARELAGIESYTLWSVRAIVLLSIVVNAPVSIVTGMLFPTACRWVRRQQSAAGAPVSRVYIIEAVGSFVGGLGVTVLLGFGVSSVRIFFVLAFIVSVSAFCVRLAKAKSRLWVIVPLCVLVCPVFGAEWVQQQLRIIRWTSLLGAGAPDGSFQTAQAEYLYGTYHDQWIVVREGSVAEALPDESAAGRTAAISLCQRPDARRVLVIGSGLGLCRALLELPQIETVTWAHPDSEYMQKVNRYIPPELKITGRRLVPLAGDIRAVLAKKEQLFDIVILNLADATSSALNRYYTLEFYRQIKESLSAGGVLSVRAAGGENIMGTELINLGASTQKTLEKVFSRLVLTPGEDTWFIASDSGELTGDPGTLKDRFAAIEGSSRVFNPQALLSVYLPDRAAKALENYSTADLPDEFLINRDSRPLTHLYSLLLAAKQSGAPVARLVKHLILAGALVFVIPILVFAALRLSYLLRPVREGRASGFDSSFLVFSAGCVAIGVVIVLMYLYQTRFGSLYLYIGVISSLFMVGLTAGAASVRYLLISGRRTGAEILLLVVITAHSLILCAIAFWSGQQWPGSADAVMGILGPSHLTFAIAFVLCGLCAGGYFPIAAGQLADSAFETGEAGSKLETADHLGASVGGLLTSLALVPVLGTKVTLFVFLLLILSNVPAALLRIYKYKSGKDYFLTTAAFSLRGLGYVLFGIGASVILCSNLLAHAGSELTPSLPRYSAQALAGELRIEQASKELRDGERQSNYFSVYDVNEVVAGYIFSSEEMSPEVRGFGGRINLAIYVDADGGLVDFHIVRSNETPAYLELLERWRDSLNGRGLFAPQPFADVEAVTGATVSCEAIVSALQKSSERFATQVLERSIGAETKQLPEPAGFMPDMYAAYLIGAVALALFTIYYGGFWSRLAVLVLNLILGGIILNAQYSSEQIATLLSLHAPALKLTGALLLVIGLPVLTAIFGNIYCGYICPFGAAQELLGYIVPSRFKRPLSPERMRKARFVKYVILFVLVMVFFFSRNRTTLAADPLISVFNFQFSVSGIHWAVVNWEFSLLLILAAALIGSLFYTRFWCRYLCPAGAFLALLNNIAILKRYLPTKKFGRCEFGLTAKDQMDCIHCDRCRYIEQLRSTGFQPVKTRPGWPCHEAPGGEDMRTRVLVPSALVAAVLVSMVLLNRFKQAAPLSLHRDYYLAGVVGAGGESRDVDLQRVRTMIRQKKLSDKEAEFYKEVE